MSLPWVRLDSSIGTHDKTLRLLGDPSPKRWQAMTSYLVALGWCGGHGTDGQIDEVTLPFVHGTTTTAALLVKHGFWEVADGGWRIRNYAERQELAVVTERKRDAQRRSALRTNCLRAHGPNCGCWERTS